MIDFLKKLREKKPIPKKRSQAEDTGLKKRLKESYWIKFGIIFFTSLMLAYLISGISFPRDEKIEDLYKFFTLVLVIFSVQGALQAYFWFCQKEFFLSNKKQFLLSTILLLTVFLQTILIRVPLFNQVSYTRYIFLGPFGIILMTLFFGMRLSFLYSFVIALFLGMIKGTIPDPVVIITVNAVTSAFSSIFMKDVRNRYQMTKAAIYTGIMTLFIVIIINSVVGIVDIMNLRDYMFGAFFTGFAGLVLFIFLYFFELMFREVTDVSLLELSDLNHKLLKELVLNAPGTYHHSITVANVAEAAAEAIGARSLLVRVMAYYHDIGKLLKPEYFSENEIGAKSMHGELSASMSSLIIISHVKNGIDTAKRYNLPRVIIDAIKEHHGTSLVYFFYKQAQKEAGNSDVIKEENFRYPGPKPQSKETAILSIADTIEAASRSLAEPSPSRIKGLVGELINEKYLNGELDECTLTFRELKVIKDVIIRMLTARFHKRPVYPDKKNG
ncbi:MAG: HDIG domain-containing protein [Candidatus Aureabacteria bacterium]|nr:HDIG domain-containing protein [Candidatus Auribacterota bacterium]